MTDPEVTSLDGLTDRPHATVFEADAPRTVRLALGAGEGVAEHRHPDHDVVLYVVSGRLELRLDGEPHDVEAGDAVRFDGETPVEPRATEESVALVVLSPST